MKKTKCIAVLCIPLVMLLALLCYPGLGYWANKLVLYPFLRGNAGIYMTPFANIGVILALCLALVLELAVIHLNKTKGAIQYGK